MIFSNLIAKIGKADEVTLTNSGENKFVVCMSGANTNIKELSVSNSNYTLSPSKKVVVYSRVENIGSNKFLVKYNDNISIVEIDDL